MLGEKMYYPLEEISEDDIVFDAEQNCMVSFKNKSVNDIEKCKEALKKGKVLYSFFEGESNPRELVLKMDSMMSSQQLSPGYFSKIEPTGCPEKPVLAFKDRMIGVFSKGENTAQKKYAEDLESYNQWQQQSAQYQNELSLVSGLKSKRKSMIDDMIADGYCPLIDPEQISNSFLDEEEEKAKEEMEAELTMLFSKQAQMMYLKAHGLTEEQQEEAGGDFINMCCNLLALFDAKTKLLNAKDKKDLDRTKKAIGKEAKNLKDTLKDASNETLMDFVDELNSPTEDSQDIPDLTVVLKKVEMLRNDCETAREDTKRKFEELSASITPDDSIYKKIADLMALKMLYREIPNIDLKHAKLTKLFEKFSQMYFENLNLMDVKKKNEITLELLNNKGIENKWNGFEEISRKLICEGSIFVGKQKGFTEKTLSMEGAVPNRN